MFRIKLTHLIRFRALALLAFIVFLLSGPVPEHADIIAAVFAYSLLTLTSIVIIATLLLGMMCRRSLDITVMRDGYSEFAQSKYPPSLLPLSFLFRISPLRLLPFFSLRVKLMFQEKNVETGEHILTGSIHTPNYFRDEIQFAHRGQWTINALQASLEDQFGLSCFQWKVTGPSIQQTVSISPGIAPSSTLPILSSSFRTGDDLPHTEKRHGEPFDLKPYHPSDGVRKLLWKTYAKTGALISRHPERSMTPEGRIAIFVFAEAQEDYVCSDALAYLQKIEEAGIEISAGCLGMRDRSPAPSTEEAEELFMNTVWDAQSIRASQDLQQLIEDTNTNGDQQDISRIVIFFGKMHRQGEQHSALLSECGAMLQRKGIEPVFVGISPDQPMTLSQSIRDTSQEREPLRSLFHTMIYVPDAPKKQPEEDISAFIQAKCAEQNWEFM